MRLDKFFASQSLASRKEVKELVKNLPIKVKRKSKKLSKYIVVEKGITKRAASVDFFKSSPPSKSRRYAPRLFRRRARRLNRYVPRHSDVLLHEHSRCEGI